MPVIGPGKAQEQELLERCLCGNHMKTVKGRIEPGQCFAEGKKLEQEVPTAPDRRYEETLAWLQKLHHRGV